MHLSLNNNFQDLHALFTEEHNSVILGTIASLIEKTNTWRKE